MPSLTATGSNSGPKMMSAAAPSSTEPITISTAIEPEVIQTLLSQRHPGYLIEAQRRSRHPAVALIQVDNAPTTSLMTSRSFANDLNLMNRVQPFGRVRIMKVS
jgi:hypothetical protein